MTEDLSIYHDLIGNLFTKPSISEEWASYRLSESQVEFYREYGYLSGIRMLDDEQVEVLREELRGLIDPAHPGHQLFYEFNSNESADPEKILFHALGAWRITQGVHDLPWNPRFTVPASQLLNGAVRFWHDQIFYKPAHHGGVVIWHQDYSYWTRTQPMAHLSCWIGLDDSTRENGCVHYVPGSHRWDLLLFASVALAVDNPVERWAKAVGGRDKVAAIKSIYREATIQYGGFEGTLKVWHTADGKYRKEEQVATYSCSLLSFRNVATAL